MPSFFDLHSHLLFGVDDGAKTKEEMFAMLDTAYADGTRALCLTPHFSPYLFGDTYQSSQEAFGVLKDYAEKTYPDMELFLGHELGYFDACTEALRQGRCRTLNGSRYLLVDFPEDVGFFEIRNAVNRLRGEGYVPVLAHTERYPCLTDKLDWVEAFCRDGGLVQVNASSAVGGWGRCAKGQWKKLIKGGLVHIVSSDGHNMTTRQPRISVCLPLLTRWCKPDAVRALTWDNAWRVVHDEPVGEDTAE